MSRRERFSRPLLVAFLMVAWFVANSHCSFAAAFKNMAATGVIATEEMPMAAPCTQRQKKRSSHKKRIIDAAICHAAKIYRQPRPSA